MILFRKILLWIFISWWMIPCIWTLIFLISFIMFGFKQTKEICFELTKEFAGCNF